MGKVRLRSVSETVSTTVSNIFIDYYMPQANGAYVKVYLYLLRCLSESPEDFSISYLADRLEDTENDVTRALRYWEKVGLLELAEDASHAISSITLNPPSLGARVIAPQGAAYGRIATGAAAVPQEAASREGWAMGEPAMPQVDAPPQGVATARPCAPMQSGVAAGSAPQGATAADGTMAQGQRAGACAQGTPGASQEAAQEGRAIGEPAMPQEATSPQEAAPTQEPFPPKRPAYTTEQMRALTEDRNVQWLTNAIEHYLERPLTPKDTQLILYLYDSVGFSSELILYLYEYCISKGKKNPSYIEKVAISWAEQGISTAEEAEEASCLYDAGYAAVAKAFGLDRKPGAVERRFIDRWTGQYGFSPEIISEACGRTLLRAGKADFKYADKILKDWHEKGVRTPGDIAAQDDAFHAAKKDAEEKRQDARARAAEGRGREAGNRFNAFPQRSYSKKDYQDLERRLLTK